MRKTVLCIGVVVLFTSTSVFAANFWGALINGSYRINSYSTGARTENGSTGSPTSGATGTQYANTSGSSGTGLVLQGQGAAGYQDSDSDSQEQGVIAGQGQVVSNSGDGQASGTQSGSAGQTQTTTTAWGTAVQSQRVTGMQSATVVGTSPASSGTVVQTSTVQVYQSQSY